MKKLLKSLVATTALLAVTVPTSVFAAMPDNSKTAGVKAVVDEEISLTLSKNLLEFYLNDEELKKETIVVTGSTNTALGYEISVNAETDHESLKNSISSINTVIPTLTEDVAEANFPLNTWGYSNDSGDLTFEAVTLAPKTVFTRSINGTSSHDFTVGVRAEDNLAGGSYENKLLFTIVGKPESVGKTITGISTMQQMTVETCMNSAIGETKQLKDTRDDKKYWVTKLADGNCWMTQNLDLDLDSTKTYTPDDTDIKKDWTPSANTIKDAANLYDGWLDKSIPTHSFDPGTFYIGNGGFGIGYSDVSDFYDSDTYSDCNPLGECGETYLNITTTPPEEGGEHYHIGNQYDWFTATATSLEDMSPTAKSICPKGWRLPSYNEYDNLQYVYYDDGDDTLLRREPGYFNRAGYIYSWEDGEVHVDLHDTGLGGGYWTVYIGSDDNMQYPYTLYLDGDLWFSSGDVWEGYSVRCIAKRAPVVVTLKSTDGTNLGYITNEGTIILPEGAEKEGQYFLGWSENPETDDPEYLPGDAINEDKTLYAIYITPIPLSEITTMQEMTRPTCAITEVNTTKQLTDTRDGKKYWVTKLADGNCWMTQNLDFDLDTNTTLTPADSDVHEDWTPGRSTVHGRAELASRGWMDDEYTAESFDPGDYYEDGTYFTALNYCNYLVSSCSHIRTTPYDLNGEHGHIGNFYNWAAAIASNDTSNYDDSDEIFEYAEDSICPKGWRLPNSTYEYTSSIEDSSEASDLIAGPVYLVRGGYMWSANESFYYNTYVSKEGYYWTNEAYISTEYTYAYQLHFNSEEINHYVVQRYRGASVRCIAR